jgi:hypothetical protein
LIADCDLSEIERTRQGWPFLRDRRIDAYGPILSRWNADPPAGGGHASEAAGPKQGPRHGPDGKPRRGRPGRG